MGVLVGACVTVLIQSSSATSHDGQLRRRGAQDLTQAIWRHLGANIRTTIPGQIPPSRSRLRLPLHYYRRASSQLASDAPRLQKYARNGLLGFGLLFIGNADHGSSMSFLRNERNSSCSSHNPLMGFWPERCSPSLVQSSAATVSLTSRPRRTGPLAPPRSHPHHLG